MSNASQTSYQYYMDNAYPGDIADLTKSNRVDSFLNDDNGAIDFGLGVVRGITDYAAQLPSASDNFFLGVTVRELARENVDYISTTYLPRDVMSVMRTGKIYVVCEVPVNIGDPVFCRFSATSGQELGAFRNDDDSGTAFRVTNAYFDIVSSNDPIPCIVFENLFVPAPPPELGYLIDNNLQFIFDNNFQPILVKA